MKENINLDRDIQNARRWSFFIDGYSASINEERTSPYPRIFVLPLSVERLYLWMSYRQDQGHYHIDHQVRKKPPKAGDFVERSAWVKYMINSYSIPNEGLLGYSDIMSSYRHYSYGTCLSTEKHLENCRTVHFVKL